MSRNVIFSWRPDVCVWMCVYVQFSTFQKARYLINSLKYQYEIWFTSKAVTTLQSCLFSWELMPDLWFYGILNFLKNVRGSSNFRKIRAIVLKLHPNILYRSTNLGIEFGQNRLKRSNFFRFWTFSEFSQNCPAQANLNLSSWNFVRKFTNTE